MQLLLATTNKGKIIEMTEALHGLPLTIQTPIDLGITVSPHETGDTFEANAIEKARFYFTQSKMPTLADDSGIIVEALHNELGVHTRRWGAGPTASDQEWIGFFLDRMRHESNKKAEFVCVLVLIDADGKEHLFEGRCSGVITDSLEAEYLPGLPISACFKPDGHSVVYSAMNLDQKNSTSHRGRALQKLRDHFALRVVV
ncbi:MAG: non-canonical purine NTP pyrophosphatase [Candidatus Peribacteraceae bacterium]